MSATPMPLKSRPLRVASVKPRAGAMAAMAPSARLMELPMAGALAVSSSSLIQRVMARRMA